MSRGLRFFSPWPTYGQTSLNPQDLSFAWSQKALFLHYVSSDNQPFFPGYDLLVEDKNYGFHSIQSSKRRHNIRWALKHCSVKRISFESLVKLGAPLIEDTHNRQGRNFNESVLEMWKNYFRLAESNPLFEAWGVFVSNCLAACAIHITLYGVVYIEMTFSRTDLLKYHPVDALCFVSTQQAMARDGVAQVSYGRRPITGEAESLINFKESMGFKRVTIKERIEVNPILKPVLFGGLRSVVHKVSEWCYDRSMYARIIAGVTNTLHGQVRRSD